MNRLFLIDASGYIFRAYYAIRPLSTSKGLPTNALFGFTSMLLKLLKEERPEMVGVVFDVARKTFRNEKYPAYKANRDEPPPDLIPQFPYFRKIVKALNLPVLELPNYEADDVIGTIAKKFEKKGWETVIVSGDKDLMQLVDDKVCVFDSMREKWIREPQVMEKFGVGPRQVTDVLGLAGDSSDNIPGVPGIGDKTATKLIQEYGTLEAALASAGLVGGKLGEKLVQFADQARLCKELATIVTDAPLEYNLEDFRHQDPDPAALKELFEELEFRKFLAELAPQKTLSAEKYRLVCTPEELESLTRELECLREGAGFAFDTETTGLDTLTADLVGISLSCKKGEAFYIPIGHSCLGRERQLSWEEIRSALQPILENPNIAKYAQNAKYDYAILKKVGIEVRGIEVDTLLASYLLNPDGAHNLDQLAQEFLSHKTTTYKEVVGTGKKEKSFAEVDLEVARDYSCEDADVTWRLTELLVPRLKEEGLEALFREVEMPLVFVLAAMERNGVKVDVPRLRRTSEEYATKIAELEKAAHKSSGIEFNLGSTRQLGEILFEKMKLPVIRRTKTGYSTDVDVLTELAKNHEVPRLLLKYRALTKLKSTYLDALADLVHPATGRVHTSFNQTIAATGRLSSSDPNLQNIPIRTEEGRKIREAFIPEAGNALISADYSQIELRILAHMTGDAALVEAFTKDRDVHSATAAGIFGVPEEKVTSAQRAVGKTVNFAVLYGQGAVSLGQQLEIPTREAEEYIRNYFRRFASVAAFKEKTLEEVRKSKVVRTLFGRLRRFPDIDSPNGMTRGMSERTAFNTVFQGTAADLIKKAMIRIQARIEKDFPKAMMLIQVHDELVFEAPEKEVDRFTEMVKGEMEGVAPLRVPLKVEVGAGKNWGEAH